MPKFDKSLAWFRRDLRSFDHAALFHGLKESKAVFCVFIFDKEILDQLPGKAAGSNSSMPVSANFRRSCASWEAI